MDILLYPILLTSIPCHIPLLGSLIRPLGPRSQAVERATLGHGASGLAESKGVGFARHQQAATTGQAWKMMRARGPDNGQPG